MANNKNNGQTSAPTVKKRSQLQEMWRRLKKNKPAVVGMCIIIAIALMAIFAPYVTPYDYAKQDLKATFIKPCAEHIMGTDNFGRDIYTRIVYGARISLAIGLVSVTIGCLVGGSLGAIAAYYGGKVDNGIMRTLDVINSIPSLLLAISLSASLGTGLGNAMMAVGFSSIPTYARIVRASVMSVKGEEYVEAAISLGASTKRVILRHIIPNCLAPLIVQASMRVAGAIITAASLSFIGLGVQPPTPEWGSMLSTGRQYIRTHWHMIIFPGLAIMVTVTSLNLFGDGVRDALDPRLKQ
jgi:peptide/nickel transport system permease protein